MHRSPRLTLATLTFSIVLPGCATDEPTQTSDSSSDSSGSSASTVGTTSATSATQTTSASESTGAAEASASTTDDPDTGDSSGSNDASSESTTGSGALYELLDPMAEHFEMTSPEWAAAWWQWAYALPFTGHPLFDDTGINCAAGQAGPVFFLGGTFGGAPVVRACSAPAQTAIFLPIVNSTWDNAGIPMDMWLTDEELQAGASGFIDGVDDFSIEIDGDVYDMASLGDYRVGMYQSTYDVPEDDSLYDMFGLPVPVAGTVDPTFGDGIYVMIQFEPGDHALRILAADAMDPGNPDDDFTIDVTYALTVE